MRKDRTVCKHNDDVQVWTTESNKLASIQKLYTVMLDGQLFFVKRGVTVGELFKASAEMPTFDSMRELLGMQLKQFRDKPDGKITGMAPF